MKIFLFDPISGSHHAAFNATVAEAVTRLEEVVGVHMLLPQSQMRSRVLDEVFQNPKVQAHSPTVREGGQGMIRRFDTVRRLWKFYAYFFESVAKLKPDVVMFLAADNTLAPITLMLMAKRWGQLRSRIFIIFHNNLENLARARMKRRLWVAGLRMANAKIIVLAPFLASVERRMMPGVDVRVLPHPTYGHLYRRWSKKDLSPLREIDFLFAGRHARQAFHSGFIGVFLECCSDLLDRVKRSDVTVALPSNLEVNAPQGLSLHPYPPNPSTPEYLSLIARSRFAVIPTCSGSRLTASGLLADLLTCGTPVIAPHEGTWLWQVAPENRQFLFNGIEDLHRSVFKALTMSQGEFEALSRNVMEYGCRFSIGSTTEYLSRILLEHKA